MSRSEPTKYWIGYDVAEIPLQKQSKYSPDVLSLYIGVAEVEDGDYKYNKWDLDEPETYN